MSGSKKIFLIDDDTDLAEIMEEILKQEKYQVHYFSDGDGLEKELLELMPHLVIVDYLMPKKNGDVIVAEIRHNPKLKRIPIIMIAANPSYKKEGLRAGINEFLEKPFDIDRLLQVIKRNIL